MSIIEPKQLLILFLESQIRNAKGVLLVCSLSDAQSVSEIQRYADLVVRCKDLDNIAQFPSVLVLNKSDLKEELEVSEKQMQQLQQSLHNIPMYLTSAKNNENVEEAITFLAKRVAKLFAFKHKDEIKSEIGKKKKQCILM